jgi:hypothetical protein
MDYRRRNPKSRYPSPPDIVQRLSALAQTARTDLGDSLQNQPGADLRPPGNHPAE